MQTTCYIPAEKKTNNSTQTNVKNKLMRGIKEIERARENGSPEIAVYVYISV